MNLSINDTLKDRLLNELKTANLRFQQTYPGDKPGRQPVHTVYGGADSFRSDTCVKMGEVALKNLQDYAPDFVALARILQLPGHECLPKLGKDISLLVNKLNDMPETERKKETAWLSYAVYNKIIHKLKTEAVEDFRIDFEDGFGNRPDDEEDQTAVTAARELAIGLKNKTVSPFTGIRIKPFTEDFKYRGVRTLDLFVTTLLRENGGVLPGNFVVMLPKVTIPEQMTTMARLFDILEKENGLSPGSLKMETMIEGDFHEGIKTCQT